MNTVGITWILVGVVVAGALWRRGAPPGAVGAALVAWPLLIPLLRPSPPVAPRGAAAERIDRALDALLETLADPAAAEVGFDGDLVALRAALHRVDSRVRLVDRLLEEEPSSASAPALDAARASARADIERVLAEVAEVRLQVGLAALAGDGARLRARLQELSARAAALDEVDRA